MKKYEVFLLVIAAFVFGFLGARVEGIVSAQEDDTEMIHACVVPASGTIHILADGESCRPSEVPLSWSKVGAVGESEPHYIFDAGIYSQAFGDWLVGRDLSGIVWIDGASDANWQGASLSDAYVRFVWFQDADFTGADLHGANFVDGSFEDCNFTEANLLDATFENMFNIAGNTWSNTICPDGTNSDDNGGTCIGHLAPLP